MDFVRGTTRVMSSVQNRSEITVDTVTCISPPWLARRVSHLSRSIQLWLSRSSLVPLAAPVAVSTPIAPPGLPDYTPAAATAMATAPLAAVADDDVVMSALATTATAAAEAGCLPTETSPCAEDAPSTEEELYADWHVTDEEVPLRRDQIEADENAIRECNHARARWYGQFYANEWSLAGRGAFSRVYRLRVATDLVEHAGSAPEDREFALEPKAGSSMHARRPRRSEWIAAKIWMLPLASKPTRDSSCEDVPVVEGPPVYLQLYRAVEGGASTSLSLEGVGMGDIAIEHVDAGAISKQHDLACELRHARMSVYLEARALHLLQGIEPPVVPRLFRSSFSTIRGTIVCTSLAVCSLHTLFDSLAEFINLRSTVPVQSDQAHVCSWTRVADVMPVHTRKDGDTVHRPLPIHRAGPDGMAIAASEESGLPRVQRIHTTECVRLSWDDIEHIIYSMARCLAEAHQRRLIHRDVTTLNFLLVPEEMDRGRMRVCLADWASSTMVPEGSDAILPNPDDEGAYYVTRWYRPPELILTPYNAYSYAVDIWSLGVCITDVMRGFIHMANSLFAVRNVRSVSHRRPSESGIKLSRSDLAKMAYVRNVSSVIGQPPQGSTMRTLVSSFLLMGMAASKNIQLEWPIGRRAQDNPASDTEKLDRERDDTKAVTSPIPFRQLRLPLTPEEEEAGGVQADVLDLTRTIWKWVQRSKLVECMELPALYPDGRIPAPTLLLLSRLLRWNPAERTPAREIISQPAFWTRPIEDIVNHRLCIRRTCGYE